MESFGTLLKIQSLKSCFWYLKDNTKLKLSNRTLVNTVSAGHHLNHLATPSHKVSEWSKNLANGLGFICVIF